MRRMPIVVLLHLPSALLAASNYCMTERELLADEASGFLAAQEISARLCDLRHGSKSGDVPMERLHQEIAARFMVQWAALADARVGRYRRWYGAEWQQQLDTDNVEVSKRTLAELKFSKAISQAIVDEL